MRKAPLVLLIAGACLLGSAFVAAGSESSPGAVRHLPESYRPGESFVVTIELIQVPGPGLYAVRETVPGNWTVADVSHDGRFDSRSDQVQWFFSLDGSEPFSSHYRITPPDDAREIVEFSGDISYEGQVYPIGSGDEGLLVPADDIDPGPSPDPEPPADPDDPGPDPGEPDQTEPTATRTLPTGYRAGEPFLVTIEVHLGGESSGLAVRERLPTGWSAQNVSDEGRFMPHAGAAAWFVMHPEETFVLSYEAVPPADAGDGVTFSGNLAVDGEQFPVGDDDLDGETIAIMGASSIALLEESADDPSRTTVVSTRTLPATYREGEPFVVLVEIRPGADVRGYVVEEIIPEGWAATGIDKGGVFDPELNRIKWEWNDGLERTVTYRMQAGSGTTGTAQLEGRTIVTAVAIGGAAKLSGP